MNKTKQVKKLEFAQSVLNGSDMRNISDGQKAIQLIQEVKDELTQVPKVPQCFDDWYQGLINDSLVAFMSASHPDNSLLSMKLVIGDIIAPATNEKFNNLSDSERGIRDFVLQDIHNYEVLLEAIETGNYEVVENATK